MLPTLQYHQSMHESFGETTQTEDKLSQRETLLQASITTHGNSNDNSLHLQSSVREPAKRVSKVVPSLAFSKTINEKDIDEQL